MRITNNLNLPQPLVSAVEREYQYKDKQYSVTALLKGTCQAILERRYHDEIEQDVSDMAWLILGNSVHKILEEAQETIDQLKENKLVLPLENGYKLSGIFDLYDDKTKTVTDWKTASVNKVLFNDWDDYKKQTLIYCWMLRKIGFDARRGEVVVILKDHSKTKAKVQSDYPMTPIYKIGWNFSDKEFEEIETEIMERFELIKEQEKLSNEDLTPCSDKERWFRPGKVAVMKEGRKTAVKLCDTYDEAVLYMEDKRLDNKHYIEERKGKHTKCEDYCSVNKWCPFYKREVLTDE